jgi:hypothetical protein
LAHRRRSLAGLCLATGLVAAAAPVATPAAGQAPLGARQTASAEAALAVAAPIRVEFPEGRSDATAPAEVTKERPATFLLAVPQGVALTLGVSSKSGAARLSIYEEGSERALAGTEPEAGCVRWIGQATRPGGLRVVVHTAGEPTPVRLEVTLNRDLDFNAAGD